MAFSTMLGSPFTTLITWCSNPDDFVNSSTRFFSAPSAAREPSNAALANAEVRRNSRLFWTDAMVYLSFALQPHRQAL
jgi:hypothetical protein